MQAGLFLLQPGGVVALEGDATAVIDLQNPLGDVVEKVAIVGDGHHRAGVFRQMLFQPVDALGIEMIRRFVKKEHVGTLQQKLAQRDAAAFSAGEIGHLPVAGGQIHRIHGDLHLPIQIPGILGLDLILHTCLLLEQFFHLIRPDRLPQPSIDRLEAGQDRPRSGHGVHHILKHRLLRIELWLLLQITDGIAVSQTRFPFILLIDARHDLHQRALAGAVAPEQADLGAWIEGDIDVLEQFPLAELLGEVGDLINEGGTHRSKNHS